MAEDSANDNFSEESSLSVSKHSAQRPHRVSNLGISYHQMCLSIAEMRSFPSWDTYTLQKHTHSPSLSSHSKCDQPAFCLEQSKYLLAGMTALFSWRWNRRVIKQVSAGTAEMPCFKIRISKRCHETKNVKQAVLNAGKNIVKGSHLNHAFKSEEETLLLIFPPHPEVAMDTGIFPESFPCCAWCWEWAKKLAVFPT